MYQVHSSTRCSLCLIFYIEAGQVPVGGTHNRVVHKATARCDRDLVPKCALANAMACNGAWLYKTSRCESLVCLPKRAAILQK